MASIHCICTHTHTIQTLLLSTFNRLFWALTLWVPLACNCFATPHTTLVALNYVWHRWAWQYSAHALFRNTTWRTQSVKPTHWHVRVQNKCIPKVWLTGIDIIGRVKQAYLVISMQEFLVTTLSVMFYIRATAHTLMFYVILKAGKTHAKYWTARARSPTMHC